jgi:parallel beta-helix repeat protein
VGKATTLLNNSVVSNGGDGIWTHNGCVIRANTARGNGDDGIDAINSLIEGNVASFNSGSGISATSGNIIRNHSTNNERAGVGIGGSGQSIVKDNVLRTNGTFGLDHAVLTAASGNLIAGNTAGTIRTFAPGAFLETGANVCDTDLSCP